MVSSCCSARFFMGVALHDVEFYDKHNCTYI